MNVAVAVIFSIATSFAASCAVYVITNFDDVKFFLTTRNKYTALEGIWHQYHLTRDDGTPVWVRHSENYAITPTGRVRGESAGHHEKRLAYKFGGSIRGGILRVTYQNISAQEEDPVARYPNLLNSNLLIGAWMGKDYDQQWVVGPIILSRTELSEDERTELVARRDYFIRAGT